MHLSLNVNSQENGNAHINDVVLQLSKLPNLA
jgi:hypothetical protein